MQPAAETGKVHFDCLAVAPELDDIHPRLACFKSRNVLLRDLRSLGHIGLQQTTALAGLAQPLQEEAARARGKEIAEQSRNEYNAKTPEEKEAIRRRIAQILNQPGTANTNEEQQPTPAP